MQVIDYRACKELPNDVFMAAVDRAAALRGYGSATRWDVAMVLGGYAEHVINGAPMFEVPGVPEKVVLAKARKLIRRGQLDGCACGCRGDFSRQTDNG